jgi:hypothetical protein
MEPRHVNPKNDYAFKRISGQEDTKDILARRSAAQPGEQAGILNGRLETARRMLDGGISIEDVTRYTGLPREQFS